GRQAAGQVLARDAQAPVSGRAHGVDGGVVVPRQVGGGEVPAELDVAEVAQARVAEGALVEARDRLQLLVVGRHAEAHQAVRRGQAVEQVDGDVLTPLEERLGGVEASGAGTDDGDAQRRAHGGGVFHTRDYCRAAREPGRLAAGAATAQASAAHRGGVKLTGHMVPPPEPAVLASAGARAGAPLRVLKFGGTSVGDLDRIDKVAARLARAVAAGEKLVVVVSAMGRTTDRLLGMAREL